MLSPSIREYNKVAQTTAPAFTHQVHSFRSYTAQEDNEISFEEGEMIYNVDTTISDDWWEGTNIHNESGLFPGKCQYACGLVGF